MRQRRRAARVPNSLVASAALMTSRSTASAARPTQWMEKAWGHYDDNGEYRFGVGWLANSMSRVNLIAAVPPTNPGDDPTPIDLETDPQLAEVVEIVKGIAGGIEGHGALLHDCSIQLTVPGVGYIWTTADDEEDSFSQWRVLSTSEVKTEGDSLQVRIRKEDGSDGGWRDLVDGKDVLIKVWRPHPRESWKPDSPSRAIIRTLDQVRMLDDHIDATGESILMGAGLLIMPEEMVFPPNQGSANRPQANDDDDEERSGDDDFLETLMTTMETARTDRDSRAARTPLMIRVPGELVDKVQHITFSTKFDDQVESLRDKAVRRIALGLDMPPEVLLGMAEANHWTAWQVTEEAITLQIEPMAEIICHALTKHYMRLMLADLGRDPSEAIVWFDTTDLRTRPDLSAKAGEAYDRGEYKAEAYLRESGLSPEDMPNDQEKAKRLLLKTAETNPMALPAVAATLYALGMLTEAIPLPQAPATPALDVPASGDEGNTLPERADEPDDGEAPAEQAASINPAVVVAAADGIVWRALEKCGMKLRQAKAKADKVAADTIPCADPAAFHTTCPATQYASIEHLLAGAWDRVPAIADRYGLSPEALTDALNSYTVALVATGNPHDEDRLARALGALAPA